MKKKDERKGQQSPAGGAKRTVAPMGNAQYDPAQQSRRQDLPADVRQGQGERSRGTAPSSAPDRSQQPRPHERDRTGVQERNEGEDREAD